MTRQQKIFNGLKTFFYAVRPLLLYILVPGVCLSIGYIVRHYSNGKNQFFYESGNFYTCLSLVIIWLILKKRAKKRDTTLSKDATLDMGEWNTKLCLLYGAFGAASSFFLSALITIMPSFMTKSYKADSSEIFSGADLVLVIITVVFMAPVLEEMIFRGYMLNRLLGFFGEKAAIYITAVIFALCHANIIWIIYAFAFGLLLAWISIKKDNILFSICVHIGFNLPSAFIACINYSTGAKNVLFGNRLIVFFMGTIGFMTALLIYRYVKKIDTELFN